MTALIYEQPCATEQRRLRKRGAAPDPAVRTFIHPEVCEGCGDCGNASDCLSVEPLETPLGRKRKINQSSCNKDQTCVNGFCPSFITVHGGKFQESGKSGAQKAASDQPLVLPIFAAPASAYNVLFAGIGGTGVVTVSSVLAKAAQIAGLAVSTLDVTGLSQKYGGVQSHVRLAPAGEELPASRIAQGQADVLIGCDLLVSAEMDVLTRLRPQQAKVVVNTTVSPAADFTRNPDWQADPALVLQGIRSASTDILSADVSRLAVAELGDAIGANLMLLGMAWQRGWIPIPLDAMLQAIRGQRGAEFNEAAFTYGRRTAHAMAGDSVNEQVIQFVPKQAKTLDDWMDLHQSRLLAYQGNALVQRYASRIKNLAQAESAAGFGDELSKAAARGYFKLLAHKDEYEVARLLTDTVFHKELQAQFDGPVQLRAHLGGGFLTRKDPVTGKPVKRELKGWIWPALHILAALRPIRGTVLDPWRNNPERVLSRQWLEQYERDLELMQQSLGQDCNASTHAALCKLARAPEKLRGYGHVREASALQAEAHRQEILRSLNPSPQALAA